MNHSCVSCLSGGVFVDFGKGILRVRHKCVLCLGWDCGVVVEFVVDVVVADPVIAHSGREGHGRAGGTFM